MVAQAAASWQGRALYPHLHFCSSDFGAKSGVSSVTLEDASLLLCRMGQACKPPTLPHYPILVAILLPCTHTTPYPVS